MEYQRIDPPTPTILDTQPALVFAVASTIALLQERDKRILEAVEILKLVDDVQNKVTEMHLQSSGSPANDIQVFTKELQLILVDEKAIEATIGTTKRIEIEWLPFMNVLLYTSIVLVMRSEEQEFIQSVLQNLLPAASRFWTIGNEKFPSILVPESDGDWLDIVWSLVYEQTIPDAGCLPSTVSIMARLIRIYLPYSGERASGVIFERHGFDIRTDKDFLSLLQRGLVHSDGAVRKQSLFILKQIIKFSTLYLQPPLESEDFSISKLFIWNARDRERWGELWRQFFLLYESVQETQVHIVEPMLPLLCGLVSGSEDVNTPTLPFEWWAIIITRGISSDSGRVRGRLLEAILEMNLTEYPRLVAARDFLFGTMMEALDSTSLYHAHSDVGPTTVSPFGMNVARFYCSYLRALDKEQRPNAVSDYLLHVSEMRGATPVLFFLQALLLLPAEQILDRKGVEQLCIFSSNTTTTLHNIKARQLCRWQLLHIFINLAVPSELNFADISGALYAFVRDWPEPFTIESKEYGEITAWINDNFTEDYVEQNVALAVQQFFIASTICPVPVMRRKAEEIACMLSFTLAKEGGFSQSVRPLYQQMAQLDGTVETLFALTAVALFVALNETVSRVSKGTADLLGSLDVGPRLYDWIDVVGSLLLTRPSDLPDLASVSILLEGQRIFLKKATEEPGTLVTYLDILLYRLAERLGTFSQAATSEAAESYLMQLQKLVVIELMVSSLKILHEAKAFHLGFSITSRTLEEISTMELEKAPGMTDIQAEEWNNLVLTFSVGKWTLLATIAAFTMASKELRGMVDIAALFQRCLLALESARFKSVLAILDCMKVLVALGEDSEPLISTTLIRESIRVSLELLDDTYSTPVWYQLYLETFIDYFFQPILLSRNDIAGDPEGLAGELIHQLLHPTGGTGCKNVVAHLAKNLVAFWSTPQGHPSLLALQPFFTELALYGPIREQSDDRLVAALNHRNQPGEMALGSDYLARVHMNSLLLHLDREALDDRNFALVMIDDLLDTVSS